MRKLEAVNENAMRRPLILLAAIGTHHEPAARDR
jgi:hypothetical protein